MDDPMVPRSLGALIRTRRRELGWSQEQLADQVAACGDPTIRQSDISRLELGKVGLPRAARLRALAAALDLPLGELLARAGWDGAETAFAPNGASSVAAGTGTPLETGDARNGRSVPPLVTHDPVVVPLETFQRLREAIAHSQALQASTAALLVRSRTLFHDGHQTDPAPSLGASREVHDGSPAR
jgi:transcriptional regulator with XRE-family HTH domain